ncbi:outer membrane protein assembly factor BamB family protein [Halorubrum vacuolatum]|uniref:PQQ-like domain-containing protein n=1 Tax=Halorubrum vacuolatum TaxID=63740 RepID=A0A238V8J1_HALVU|nr:PQQ-binding-like beta-propeller repeat protein [Halorubrum vacuolatum]SNR30730.1 PQQ-like domain-containing protein [Halorubrum vacuolatum]
MDRRVLFAGLILFAGGAAGVGVAVFAFVGLDADTAGAEIIWESDPAEGDDGTGAVVATVDGDPSVIQPAIDDDAAAIRALDMAGEVAWTVSVPGDVEPDGTSDLVATEMNDEPVIAFTTEAGDLVVLDAADGEARLTVSLGSGSTLAPVATDLTDDGEPEFVVLRDDGTALAIGGDGETFFETEIEGDAALQPLAITGEESAVDDSADADSGTLVDDGIALLTDGDGVQQVTVLDAAGEVVWAEAPEGTTLSWNAADSRRGGIIALGSSDGMLETMEASDGSTRYDVGLQDVPVDVGDADSGRVHVGGVGDIWAVDLLDGEVVWKQQYGGETRVNEPAVGDVTGDGSAEVVAVNRGGEVTAMNRNGEVVLRGDAGSVVVYAAPLFADVTGDGTDETLIVTEDGTVIALAA